MAPIFTGVARAIGGFAFKAASDGEASSPLTATGGNSTSTPGD